uniref:Probable RNA polymerase II nuclear localization protein SLC7A6OS n=1 Tax=Spongospora subterranea TaxID=70186 RepID=A0A0H5RCT2_9EUKA|eukprot:CRZ06309.1 hypothetical protein [Spongospora subterranea]
MSNDAVNEPAPILLVRVKRPRTSLPVDDLVVEGPCRKRPATSSVAAAASCLQNISIDGDNHSEPLTSSKKWFCRLETMEKGENFEGTEIQSRLRDRLKDFKAGDLTTIRTSSLARKRQDHSSIAGRLRAMQIEASRFKFIDIDPLKPATASESASTRSNFDNLMDRYKDQFDNIHTADDFVWDIFVCNGNASSLQISDSAYLDLRSELELDPLNDELLFDESCEEEYDSEDSNAADNPYCSYPEDESDSGSDDSVSDYSNDLYNNDDDLDEIDEYDQT